MEVTSRSTRTRRWLSSFAPMTKRTRVPLFEDGFRYHAVDPLSPVDNLGHMIVHGDTRDHISFFSREVRKLLSDEAYSLTHSDFHRLFQILMESHDHPVRGRLGTRPAQFHVLADDELELAPHARFDRRQIDFAMTLGGMRITG